MAAIVSTNAPPCRMLLGGVWRESQATQFSEITNPATGEILARLPHSTREEVNAAVEAAAGAFRAWSATPPVERARVLFRYKMLLEEHLEELARQVTQENGKTLPDARGSVRRGIEVVEFACGIPTLMMGRTAENVGRDVDSSTVRQPLGVCVGIPPFNFPAMIPLWMFPLAIACGNTFVFKPSDKAPLTAMIQARLFQEAGLPAGVLNVVHGLKETVDALLTHRKVKAVSFVGSSAVAQYVYATAAAHGKRVQAMGGAKNHMVVMPDADMSAAVKGILSSSFGSAGQRCMAGSVLVTVGDAAEKLLPLLVEEAGKLRVAPGTEESADLGPVITRQARERILSYIEKGEKEGARLALDGRRKATPKEGNFLAPTIFDNVRPEMSIAREEIFGPVLAVMRAGSLDEALDRVNASSYGNGAVIFTRDGGWAREFSTRVQAGMVGVNVGVPAPTGIFPFAGWKGSFFGTLHANGQDAVEFFTETKVITSRWEKRPL